MTRDVELVLTLRAQSLLKRALLARGRRRALLLHLANKLLDAVLPD
jgi:hypothetical protein